MAYRIVDLVILAPLLHLYFIQRRLHAFEFVALRARHAYAPRLANRSAGVGSKVADADAIVLRASVGVGV